MPMKPIKMTTPEEVQGLSKRLAELSLLQPVGWWMEHATRNECCRGKDEPGCDVGAALQRLHSKEIAKRLTQ